MKRKGLLLVVSGPSGAGKGTICKEFLNNNEDVKLSVSATTRNPRDGEVDGVNYFFVTKDKFKSMIVNNELLEHLENGHDVVLEIEMQGARQIKEVYPEGVFIFILPPSLDELKNRIVGRGTETEEQINKRFSCAMDEICQIENYDYFIVNKDVKNSAQELEHIISAEKNKVYRYKDNIIKKFKEEL